MSNVIIAREGPLAVFGEDEQGRTYVLTGENTAMSVAKAAEAAVSAAEAADSAAAADDAKDIVAAQQNYYATRAAGAAATPTGSIFTSDEEGALAWYRRTATAPNYVRIDYAATKTYVDVADTAAATNLASTASGKGASLVGVLGGGTVQGQITDKLDPITYRKKYLAVPAHPTTDSSSELNSRLADTSVEVIEIPDGNWRFDSQVYQTINRNVRIRGQGSGKTKIDFNHLSEGIVIQTTNNDPSTFSVTAHIEGITVTRSAGVGYTGSGRPRNISLWNMFEPVIRDVDSSGHIGYGVSSFRSIRPLFDNVRSHDANGGTLGGGMLAPSGTDAIHAYQCDEPTFLNSKGWNVGDDCISMGSLQDDVGAYMRTRNAHVKGCYGGFTLNGAAFKLYGHNESARLDANYAEAAGQGAVYVTDHDDTAAFNNFGHVIDGLTAIDCRGPQGTNAGVIRIRLYPTTTQTCAIYNLTFRNIDAVGCRNLLLMESAHANPLTNYVKDIFLEDIKFRDAAFRPEDVGGGYQAHAITLGGMQGVLSMINISMDDIIGSAFRLNTGAGQYDLFDRLVAQQFLCRGYGFDGGSAGTQGFYVGQANLEMNISKIAVSGQKRGATTSPARPIELTSIAPASYISDVSGDPDLTPLITGSYRTSDPVTAAAVPSTGTWYANDYVSNTATGTGIRGWRCNLNGTFGTLSGVTCSGTSGERKIVVNSATDIRRGHVVSVAAGFPGGRLTVAKVEGATVWLSSALNANIPAGTALSFAAPTFVIDPDPLLVVETAANIASAAATINTTNKYTGKRIWDSTNNREMRSSGTGATSTWIVVDGSVTVTPA